MHPVSKHQRPQVLRRTRVSSDSAFCNYSHRVCMQPRLDGFEYCNRHILEDKGSPFKQCQYTSTKTNKRCTSAAAKADRKDGYCPEHARRAAHIRLFISRKRCPKEAPETLLEDLEHYVSRRPGSGSSDGKRSRNSETSTSKHAKIIDYASSSDSDVEGLAVENTWLGDGDSDAESVDSEQEDPLKHAGVYTAEEVALITRDKLIRLQSLYIDQFKRLQHVMKEKRRRYLHTVHKERDALGSIHYAKHDPEQRGKYEGLVAMKRYHRRFGQEALLHRQSKERRISVSEGANYRPPTYPKCVFCKGAGKCGARTVPLSKYCNEHILHDPNQVLHKPCNFSGLCRHPIAALFDDSACIFHSQLEDIEQRLPLRKDEKDESKDEIDVVGEIDIKQEDSQHQSLQLQLQLQRQFESSTVKREIKLEVPTDAAAGNTAANDVMMKDLPAASFPKSQNSIQCSESEKISSATHALKRDDMSQVAGSSQLPGRNHTGALKIQTPGQILSAKPKDLNRTPDASLRVIAPAPNQPPPQTSPSKPAQVPLVVNDLLEEEEATKKQIDPLKRQSYTTVTASSQDKNNSHKLSENETPKRIRTASNSSANNSAIQGETASAGKRVRPESAAGSASGSPDKKEPGPELDKQPKKVSEGKSDGPFAQFKPAQPISEANSAAREKVKESGSQGKNPQAQSMESHNPDRHEAMETD